MDVHSLPKLPFASANEDSGHPRIVHNRIPTPQDLLELSSRIYKSTHKLYNEADSQGMRVYHDERIAGDVRLVMIVPSWFPKAHVSFDWERLHGDTVSVVFVIRGTMQDLIGNTRANLQLLFNKLIDDQHLPDVAADATKVIQAWTQELLLRQPVLDPSNTTSSSTNNTLNSKPLHLDVQVTGHSLGGLLAEVATVESFGFAARHGASWKCTSFESPGMPDIYHQAALRVAPVDYWQEAVTGYLAAPNPINMLYEHLGRVVHVVVPWEQTWSHVAKCVGADVARVTAWAIVGGMVLTSMKHVPALRALPGLRQQQQDEDPAAAAVAAAANAGLFGGSRVLGAQQCSAVQALLSSGVGPAAANLLAAPAATVAGPRVPGQMIFTVAETGPAAAAAGSRTLSSIAGAGMAAAAAAAHPASTATAAPSLTTAAVAAAAAAGEAAASIGGTRILNHIAYKSGLGVLATAIQGWAFGRGGVGGVLECLAGVLGVEVEALIAQHSLWPMRQCFDPHSGQLKARYRRDMMSWPHLGHRRKVLVTAAQQVAKWTLPSFICRDNVGVANLMSRTAMVEARCSRLEGYVMITDPGLESTHQQQQETLADQEFDGFLGAAAAAAGGGGRMQVVDAMEDVAAAQLLLDFQQQQQVLPGMQADVPVGLGVGLPGLLAPRRQQQQQRLPRKLLMGPGCEQQQQQQGDDVMMSDAADVLDAAECGAANSAAAAAAGSSGAAAAVTRLCNSLQSLQAVTGTSNQAVNTPVAAAAAMPVASTPCFHGSDQIGGGTSPCPSSISIRVEDFGVDDFGAHISGLGSRGTRGSTSRLQREGPTPSLTGGSADASWVALDDEEEEAGAPQQRRGRRQVMLLPGRH